MGQINTNNYPTVNSLLDADLLIVENAQNGTGTTTPKQLRENAIGTTPLQTSAQTVTGAINELKTEIDAGAGVVCYEVATITSGFLGQFSGSANLLLLHLTTDGTADASNGYMMLLSYSRPVARLAYGQLVDAEGVAYKQDVYADNTIICKISDSGAGTEADPKQVVILGIINAGFMLTPTAVISDRDIIDGQGNTLSVLAEALTKTASGNPVVITDCAGGKARSLKTTINAIQDLHGYDKPWAGGAWKNLLPTTVARVKALNTSGVWNGNVYTISNTTIEILTDETNINVHGFKVNTGSGGASAGINFSLYNSGDVPSNIKGQSIILTGCPVRTGNPYTVMLNSWGTAPAIYDNGTDHGTATFPANPRGMRCDIEIYNGSVLSNVIFYPMIRLATESDATFAPYSNECPISGRTAVPVDDDGKNLANVSNAEIGTAWNGASNTARARLVIPCKPSTTYTISINGTNNMDSVYSNYSSVVPAAGAGDPFTTSKTFTTSANSAYIIVGFNKTNVSQADINALKLQLEEGDTATSYQPYAHSSATIQLGTTVYGAEIDWDTGVVTVKTTFKQYAGDSGENWQKERDNWNVNNLNVFYIQLSETGESVGDILPPNLISDKLTAMGISQMRHTDKYGCATLTDNGAYLEIAVDFSSVADLKAWLASNPMQVEYELATPTTIQLTPTQLELLKGYNRVTIDNGSIELGYIAKLT